MRRFFAHSSSKMFTASFQQKRFFQASVAEGATSAAVLVAPTIALSSAVPFLPEKAAVVPAVESYNREAVQVAATEPQATAVQTETAETEVTEVTEVQAQANAAQHHQEGSVKISDSTKVAALKRAQAKATAPQAKRTSYCPSADTSYQVHYDYM